jgi:drug/metabolite transporter (DMT)-like permease
MKLVTQSTKAYLLLIITTWGWGCNVIFGKLAVGEISPMQLVTARWLGVTLLLFIFARKYIVRDWPVIRQHLWFVSLMGAAGFTVFNALFYVAAHKTQAINIGILQGSIPVFVLLISFILYRFKVPPIQYIGVGLTLMGIIIVASGGDLVTLLHLNFNIGDLFMLLACLLYAVYSIGLSRRPKVSSLGLFTAMAVVAFLASLPLLAIETWQQGFTPPSAKGWFVAALVTLLPSFLSQVFFIRGVEMIGAPRAGVFINLVPVFASVMAVFYLHEPLQWFQAVSLAMVLGGIGLSELGKKTLVETSA